MADRKTVVDALERCARLQDAPMSGECADCAYKESFGTCGSLSKLMMDAAELLKKSPTVGGWISVEDSLPDVNRSVIVVVQGEDYTYRTVAWLQTSGDWDSNDDGFNQGDECVAYWMPLPEPPKGVNTDAAD